MPYKPPKASDIFVAAYTNGYMMATEVNPYKESGHATIEDQCHYQWERGRSDVEADLEEATHQWCTANVPSDAEEPPHEACQSAVLATMGLFVLASAASSVISLQIEDWWTSFRRKLNTP